MCLVNMSFLNVFINVETVTGGRFMVFKIISNMSHYLVHAAFAISSLCLEMLHSVS